LIKILYLCNAIIIIMNMSNRIYQITAVLLAFLMLVTSLSLALDIHYCKGKIKSLSIFGKAKSCHEQKAIHTCPFHAKMQQQEDSNCCDNETTFVQADIDKVVSSVELADLQQLAIAFVQVFCPEVSPERQIIIFEHYKPPLIAQDISLLVQSFLL
ncbi:MAG: hypothetical protein AAGG68_18880, partial [Bacteroidota bacterium]